MGGRPLPIRVVLSPCSLDGPGPRPPRRKHIQQLPSRALFTGEFFSHVLPRSFCFLALNCLISFFSPIA